MSEVGRIGVSCPERREPDEVHLMSEKLAVVPGTEPRGAPGARSLHLTTLLPSCPLVLLNVDVGDHAVLTDRACGCPIGALGLTRRAHSIGSREKLTTEGMSFVASELAWLVEEALPRRFGGGVADYQLVEQRGELSRIEVLASPAVGELDEDEVVRTVLESLAGLGEAQRMMAEQWREAGTLRLARGMPHENGSGKVAHLYLRTAAEGGR
jgi:hypothetical protein